MDSLDIEQGHKYQFKASFISHLCAIKERKDEYTERLKTFNKRKSTKGSMVNQEYLEKQIYEQMHSLRSQSALEQWQGQG